jgi:hypothetical protein
VAIAVVINLVTGSGLLSFGFGLFLAYQIGIVDRL